MKPRAMMIIHNFRPGPVGGAELQAERLAGQLAGMGHDLQVLTRLTVPQAMPEETLQGVRVHRAAFPLPYWVKRDNGETFRYLLRRRHSFDILHVHMAFGHAVMAVVFARCFNKKCILKIACAGEFGDLNTFSKFPGFKQALRILHQADALIAISCEVQEELVAYGFPPERIRRIPNGVDTSNFRRSLGFPQTSKTRFLLIGRRHPQKGVDILLKAIRLLAERGYADRFEVFLYGVDYPEYDYRAQANHLGIEDLVCFHPFHDDLLPVYQSAQAFLLPSRGEGLSNALLEAMSMELAVIATPVSGTMDVISDGQDGLLVPSESPDGLAAAMAHIMDNPSLARHLGAQARCKIETGFSLESVALRYSDLYAELMK